MARPRAKVGNRFCMIRSRLCCLLARCETIDARLNGYLGRDEGGVSSLFERSPCDWKLDRLTVGKRG